MTENSLITGVKPSGSGVGLGLVAAQPGVHPSSVTTAVSDGFWQRFEESVGALGSPVGHLSSSQPAVRTSLLVPGLPASPAAAAASNKAFVEVPEGEVPESAAPPSSSRLPSASPAVRSAAPPAGRAEPLVNVVRGKITSSDSAALAVLDPVPQIQSLAGATAAPPKLGPTPQPAAFASLPRDTSPAKLPAGIAPKASTQIEPKPGAPPDPQTDALATSGKDTPSANPKPDSGSTTRAAATSSQPPPAPKPSYALVSPQRAATPPSALLDAIATPVPASAAATPIPFSVASAPDLPQATPIVEHSSPATPRKTPLLGAAGVTALGRSVLSEQSISGHAQLTAITLPSQLDTIPVTHSAQPPSVEASDKPQTASPRMLPDAQVTVTPGTPTPEADPAALPTTTSTRNARSVSPTHRLASSLAAASSVRSATGLDTSASTSLASTQPLAASAPLTSTAPATPSSLASPFPPLTPQAPLASSPSLASAPPQGSSGDSPGSPRTLADPNKVPAQAPSSVFPQTAVATASLDPSNALVREASTLSAEPSRINPHFAAEIASASPGMAATITPHASSLPEMKPASLFSNPVATSRTSAADEAFLGPGFAGPTHTTLIATPRVLEVGVPNGSNGWLKVRAEADGGGGVSASVAANSTNAVEALHKDLPALAAFLKEESVGVSSLVVHRSQEAGLLQPSTSGSGAGTLGSSGETPRQPNAGTDRSSSAALSQDDAAQGFARTSLAETELASPLGVTPGRGGWLNVLA